LFGVLLQGSDGNLYGATADGGANSCIISGTDYGCGTLLKITSNGTLTTLHSFDWSDGGLPARGLVLATDGNFYGTASLGGSSGFAGTIFKITSSDVLTTLYNFCSQRACVDGDEPFAGLVQDTNGKFYGTTYSGGAIAACDGGLCGTIFSLSVGLGPFVETQPTSGKVGATVKILATNLTGATNVTFNGMAAVFKVASGSLSRPRYPRVPPPAKWRWLPPATLFGATCPSGRCRDAGPWQAGTSHENARSALECGGLTPLVPGPRRKKGRRQAAALQGASRRCCEREPPKTESVKLLHTSGFGVPPQAATPCDHWPQKYFSNCLRFTHVLISICHAVRRPS
jgi:uncharacterized repeat protein (TIGR03803 family)